MSRFAFARSPGFPAAILPALAMVLPLLATTAAANPTPDAMMYFNVRPAGPESDRCATTITRCADLQPSTPEEGLLEFQIFINPQQSVHGAVPVPLLTTELSWPAGWTLVDCWGCGGAQGCSVESEYGGNPYYLAVWWPCIVPDGFFLAATLLFDVQGYGRLDTGGNSTLWLDCPDYEVHPTAHYAEAGTGCEYTDQPCVKWSFRCEPDVAGLEVLLTAPEGGTAHGELEFHIDGYPFPRCDFTANSSEPWATAYVVSDPGLNDAVLYVDADATGLEPGVHESEIQLVYDGMYDGARVRNGRCLPAILTVTPGTSAADPVDPGDNGFPGNLRPAGANPSSGPFEFTFETRTASPVRCGVFDASGREVLSLLDDEASSGRHTVIWRAVDGSGRRVAPGVYLIRLSCDGETRGSRVVVVG